MELSRESLPLVVEVVVEAMAMENCRNRIAQYNMTIEVVCTLMPNPRCQHLFTKMVEIVVVMTIVDRCCHGYPKCGHKCGSRMLN